MPYTSLHTPVLLQEVADWLEIKPGMVVIDGTLGDGGHSQMFCELVGDGGQVIGIDQDPEAVKLASERLVQFKNFHAVHGNFVDMPSLVTAKPDRILMDLGWSTTQFMVRGRGFSFLTNEPLDMRFDPTSDRPTAAEIVNTYTHEELVRIFRRFGEEPRADKIATAICEARKEKPINTTQELAFTVMKVAPRTGKIHPATQVFQSLRIAVNDELEILHTALERITEWMPSGARVAVITFHSLEDRIVKQFVAGRKDCAALTKKPIVPTEAEIQQNPRSRSSKLRVFQKV